MCKFNTGTAIIIELMIPFFMAFEGRRVQARELTVLAVLCALAIPIPNFKAIYAIIMLSGGRALRKGRV